MAEDSIDFGALEKELLGRVEAEKRYWQENDAKFRAVEQKVANYEEFRQIVMAAHLKPLDKADKIQDTSNKYVIWNTIAEMNNITNKELPSSAREINTKESEDDKIFLTSGDEFLKYLRSLNQEDRFKLLKQIHSYQFKKLFSLDLPMGLLNDLFELFLIIPTTTSDILFIISILEELSKSKRFQLNLQFLSDSEKNTGGKMFDKLNLSFENGKEELILQGVTHHDICNKISELQKKYKL